MKLESPYKGLDAFGDSDVDALLFFGREREREIVVANLIAARLTVLYGPTGVGKSSLLRAGVARALRELPEQPIVVVFDHWGGDDPSADLAAAVSQASGEPVGEGLLDVVERAQRTRDLYLVLDQAEEYFVYHEQEAGFDACLARLVGDPLRVNVLLSLREDSLAKLDRFKPRIPNVYANSLRLDRLDRGAGRTAIVRPVERWNEYESDHVAVEPALVEAVLDGVRSGGIGQVGGLGEVEGNGKPETVEAPYLQLVMQRLWDVERETDSQALRVSTLEELGGARQVVADHLKRAIDDLAPAERDVASQLFTYLVTPSGTKIAHELPDLAEYAGVTLVEATPVVETLSRHRILRPDEAGRIEIFHDVLADEVLAWRRGHDAVRALERERAEAKRRHRRLAWLAGLASAAFLGTALLAVFALTQRSHARAEARQARAHSLEASAAAALERDPELSVLLGLEATRMDPSASSEETLRTALLASRVRAVVHAGEPLLGATLRRGRIVAATSSGKVLIADAKTGRVIEDEMTGQHAIAVSFAGDGTALLTGVDGRLRLVGPGTHVLTIPNVDRALGATLSADASLGLVIGRHDVRIVDVASGRVREVIARAAVESAAISRDETRIVTGSSDEAVQIWNARTGRLLRTLPYNQGHAVAVAFSPDGTAVAGASTDGLARIWSVRNGTLTATVAGGAIALTDVSFSSDGEHVVTASRDGVARVSKADTGAPLFALSGHEGALTSAAFSGPAGSSVATASLDGTARVWDALVQPKVDELARVRGRVLSVGYLRPGVIRVDTRTGPRALDSITGKRVGGANLPRGIMHSRARSRDGAIATIRGNVVVLRRGGQTTILKGHRAPVLSVAFSPDGTLLASASRDHDVRIWDVRTGNALHVLPHNSAVRDVDFSPDGRWLITAAGRATLWNATDWTLVARLIAGAGLVTSAAFDPSGRIIVTGDADGTVGRYVCEICGSLTALEKLANARLAQTGRTLTTAEREQFAQ